MLTPGQRVTLRNNLTYNIVTTGEIVNTTATGKSFLVRDPSGSITTFHREWPSATTYLEDHGQAQDHARTRRFFITTETMPEAIN